MLSCQTARRLRSTPGAKARKPRGTKPFVIMITGNQGGRHKMYAESLGVSEYFTKPVKMDKLIATAERLVGGTPATP